MYVISHTNKKIVLNFVFNISDKSGPTEEKQSEIGWGPWIEKIVNYLSCIEGKGAWKILEIFHNSTRQLFIYYRLLFCSDVQIQLKLRFGMGNSIYT